MSKPAALITGGASGIGQALAEHLVKKGWKVTIADVNEKNGNETAKSLGADASFVRTDVTKFEDQAAMFKHAFEFGGKRLDFFAANAGITDTQGFYEDVGVDKNGDPTPLNLTALKVDLDAVIQGTWLYRHYAKQNPTPGGKVVITASVGGLYATAAKPQYIVAKHGLIGFTRSIGLTCLANDNVTVNAVCPPTILTALCPPVLHDIYPKEELTPMSTVLKAFDICLDDGKKTGKILELSINEVIERQQPPYVNEHAKWNMEDALEFFNVAYGNPLKDRAKK